MRNIILIMVSVYLFTACSGKQEVQEYNKPAVYWYNKMLKNISLYNLDAADETFTSLESEHRNSPLLSTALVILASAHLEDEQYLLANYYFDSYAKKFEDKSLEDYVRYLKIKSKFMAFKKSFRDQKLINDTIRDIDKFIKYYPNSKYIHLIKTMQSRLYMSRAKLNLEIANLYIRKDKKEAAEFYIQKAKLSWSDVKTIKDLNIPWYREIFE